MTIACAIRKAAGLLAGARLENSSQQARIVAAHLLGKSPSQLIFTDELSFSPGKEESFFSLVQRLVDGEPIQHVLGNWDFYGRTFLVKPCTLIPRPETELLVETVLRSSIPRSPMILDAGTGTGVIGITLALEIPGSTVAGTDVSPEAAELAKENALLLNAGNFLPVICDLAEPFGCCFDVITANLPYIPSGDIPFLPGIVRDHDPIIALDGGETGISLILELVESASRILKPGGLIILETGSDQSESVTQLFETRSWMNVNTHRDLAGNHRMVTAVRRSVGV